MKTPPTPSIYCFSLSISHLSLIWEPTEIKIWRQWIWPEIFISISLPVSQNFSQLDFPASHNGLIKINPNPSIDSKLLDSGHSDVLWIWFQRQGQEKKNKHIGLHPTKNLMHSQKKKSIKVNLLNRRRCFQTIYPIKGYINIKYSYSLRAKKQI